MIFILIFSGNEHVSSVEFYSIRMKILLYKFFVFFLFWICVTWNSSLVRVDLELREEQY